MTGLKYAVKTIIYCGKNGASDTRGAARKIKGILDNTISKAAYKPLQYTVKENLDEGTVEIMGVSKDNMNAFIKKIDTTHIKQDNLSVKFEDIPLAELVSGENTTENKKNREYEVENSKLEGKVQKLEGKVAEYNSSMRTYKQEVSVVQKELTDRSKELESCYGKVSGLETKVSAKNEELERKDQNIANMQDKLVKQEHVISVLEERLDKAGKETNTISVGEMDDLLIYTEKIQSNSKKIAEAAEKIANCAEFKAFKEKLNEYDIKAQECNNDIETILKNAKAICESDKKEYEAAEWTLKQYKNKDQMPELVAKQLPSEELCKQTIEKSELHAKGLKMIEDYKRNRWQLNQSGLESVTLGYVIYGGNSNDNNRITLIAPIGKKQPKNDLINAIAYHTEQAVHKLNDKMDVEKKTDDWTTVYILRPKNADIQEELSMYNRINGLKRTLADALGKTSSYINSTIPAFGVEVTHVSTESVTN